VPLAFLRRARLPKGFTPPGAPGASWAARPGLHRHAVPAARVDPRAGPPVSRMRWSWRTSIIT